MCVSQIEVNSSSAKFVMTEDFLTADMDIPFCNAKATVFLANQELPVIW